MAIQTPPLVMLRSIVTLPLAATRPWVMTRSCLMASSQRTFHLAAPHATTLDGKVDKVEKLEATVGQQQKQIETLTAQLREQAQTFTAQLKEQATQIQRMSAQFAAASPSDGELAASKFARGRTSSGRLAPRVVNNP
jgi:septal ring factor EnvC (AmiA/AmiB activator)